MSAPVKDNMATVIKYHVYVMINHVPHKEEQFFEFLLDYQIHHDHPQVYTYLHNLYTHTVAFKGPFDSCDYRSLNGIERWPTASEM